MRNQELKQRVLTEIDAASGRMIELGEDIYRHPELGFKEVRTAGIVADEFQRLGLGFHEELAVTGVKTTVSGAGPGPTVAIIGELDSVLVADHEQADPLTGAAHCCGHNAQIATMLGAANGLVRSGVLDQLAGNVVFFAVPAEEYVELEFRLGLREQGVTRYLGGKSELVRIGAFDDVDMAMMVHAYVSDDGTTIGHLNESVNGFVGKRARFIGRAAHAGGRPQDGLNALYAAQLALEAINAQRETFRDADSVRIHPILSRAGDLVNVIPSDVRLETMIRGKTLDAIRDADHKVDRALRVGAIALGCDVEITSMPGYLPLTNDDRMAHLFKENFLHFHGEETWSHGGHGSFSTDMGDLSAIMPIIEPNVAGFAGTFHGSDWRIVDHELAYLLPAKLMAMTVIDLLANNAEEGRAVIDAYQPIMTRSEYLAFMEEAGRLELFEGGEH